MNMKATVVLVVLAAATFCLEAQGCTTNSDCDSGCCLGSSCGELGNENDPCEVALSVRAGMMNTYDSSDNKYDHKCPCRSGLTCTTEGVMTPVGTCGSPP